MSLYLGNLSPRVRLDELERQFRRFGQCNVRLKDGYGFVVYEFPPDAEKALRALRGKNICGHPIELTWSNKQPKSFQRSRRGSRFYEPYNGRHFSRRNHYETRKGRSHDQREFDSAPTQADGDGEEPYIDHMLEKEGDYRHDDDLDHGGGKHLDTGMDEGLPTEPNLGEEGRWGAPTIGPLDDKEVEDKAIFDRYEPHGYDSRSEDYEYQTAVPHHEYERRSQDYEHQKMNSYGSLTRGSSRGKTRRPIIVDTDNKHPVNSNPQSKCYSCGLPGHKQRNCPRADTYRKERFTRFDRKRDSDINFRVSVRSGHRRVRPASRGSSYSKRSPPLVRRHKREMKFIGFESTEELVRKESSPTVEETHLSQHRYNSLTKKKRKEDGNPIKYESKAKRSRLSPRHSDSTASSSSLRSQIPGTSSSWRPSSSSRSVSSREHSVSSRSRSSGSTSESSRYWSKSRSSTSGRHLPCSPDEAQMDNTGNSSKSHSEKNSSPKSKLPLIDQREMTEGGGNIKVKSTNMTPSDRNRSPSANVEVEKNKNHSGSLDEDRQDSPHRIECEGRSPRPFPGKGTSAGDTLSSDDLGERRENGLSTSKVMEDIQAPLQEQNVEAPATPPAKSLTSISSQEMHTVLKHYGLTEPNKNRQDMSVEEYFGSARLWPWQVIYYRRLKKGPISTDNYARRIAQNEEFAIVDKYIRSSSGWYEESGS